MRQAPISHLLKTGTLRQRLLVQQGFRVLNQCLPVTFLQILLSAFFALAALIFKKPPDLGAFSKLSFLLEAWGILLIGVIKK